MTDAILEITDGTTTINLIQPLSGFHLTAWVPAITDYKGGGTFQNPPLANWRQLRDSKWSTAVENFTLTLNGTSPDTAAYNLQELRRLLEKANQYWTTDWQNTPVYVVARMKCETNTRYCLIIKGRLGNDRNFYEQPTIGDVTTLQELPLSIERLAWSDNIPNNGNATPISAVETYNSVNYGNVDSSGVRETSTAGNEVFIAAKRNTANITNIHLTTAGANRIGVAPPYDIINATGETYFGIDTSIANSGPFNSLVFDIGTAGVGGPTIVWEYWNGATWTTLNVRDNTNNFTNTGVNSVHWYRISSWTPNSPGGGLPTGYWVRVRITVGSFSTEPTQQNRNVYSIIWPYVEIQAADVGGDISALCKIISHNVAHDSGLFGSNSILYSSFIAGLRSVNRGANFTAYLNFSDEQNPSGVTVTNLAGASGSFLTEANSPTGRVFEYAPTGVVAITDVVKIVIDSTLADNYYGTFRAFVRINQTGGSDEDFSIRLDVFDSALLPFYQSNVVLIETATTSVILDMGAFTIQEPVGITLNEIVFTMYAQHDGAGTNELEFVDLILIPTDEFAFESTADSATGSFINEDNYFLLNGLNYKKIEPLLLQETDDTLFTRWTQISNSANPILQANSRHRIWFVQKAFLTKVTVGGFYGALSVQILDAQRYLSLRGNR